MLNQILAERATPEIFLDHNLSQNSVIIEENNSPDFLDNFQDENSSGEQSKIIRSDTNNSEENFNFDNLINPKIPGVENTANYQNKLLGETEPKDFNNTVNYDSDEQNQTAKEGFIQNKKPDSSNKRSLKDFKLF